MTTYVCGHRNPDVDSVTSAYALADLRRRTGMHDVEAICAGRLPARAVEVMAEVGKNAKFYDFGSGGKSEGGGDLLTSVIGRLPKIFAQADLTGQALNGENVDETIKRLVSSIAEPIKGQNVTPSPEIDGTAE